ncbi:uncharacterized protein [Panulirus ornatus]|uniref:uncharacterized protein isoform X2 n=1 Tax=Panulirus ornatus TaxID=150431 RepID=UPI003A8768B5
MKQTVLQWLVESVNTKNKHVRMKGRLREDAPSAEHPQHQKVWRLSNTRKKFSFASDAYVVIAICLLWRVGPVLEVNAQPPAVIPAPQPVPLQSDTPAANGMQQMHPQASTPFKMNAVLVFPPPFLYHMTYPPPPYAPPLGAAAPPVAPNGDQATSSMGVRSQSQSHKTVEKTTLVKVFTDDWDDLETCPSWCKRKDGSLHCCPDKNHHAGSCPKLREVCVLKGDEYKLNVHYCTSDKFCLDTHKCCFDRCVQARICRLAVE